MLETLRIVDYALIDDLLIEFKPGLNIFTGSTGAGKTIIVGALGLALGERATDEFIRTGASQAVVEANFTLERKSVFPNEYVGDTNEVLIRREVNRDGRSRAMINDRQATVQSLRNLGSSLVDITGQHEQKGLLDQSTHRQILDNFARIGMQLSTLSANFNKFMALKAELENIHRKQKESAAEKELLEFQIKEIESAELSEGEDEKLEKEKLQLVNAELVKAACQTCQEYIFDDSGSVTERLKTSAKEISRAAKFSDIAENIKNKIEEQALNLEEIGSLIRDLEASFEFDPSRLEIIDERIAFIKKLKRKYGQSITEIVEFLNQAKIKANSLEDIAGTEKRLHEQLKIAQEEMSLQAREISTKRIEAAVKVEKEMGKHLADLAMTGAIFKVNFETKPNPDGAYFVDSRQLEGDDAGFDKIEFLICTNPGEGLKPLASTASGGELSRIMLALCSVLTEVFPVGTLVFDEIDAGISGEVASQVGRKLQLLSKNQQVICITHLQQIASRGKAHFKVYKGKIKGRAVTRIQLLEGDERLKEIARLLAGEKISDVTLDSAAQLLKEGNS